MSSPQTFLAGRQLRPVQLPTVAGFQFLGLALGNGNSPLEVLAVTAPPDRQASVVLTLWKLRLGGRAIPLLVAVVYDDARVTLCGPVGIGNDPPVYRHLDRGLADLVCREALDQPERHAVLRFLRDALRTIESPLPGVRNEEFLATNELRVGAPGLPGWTEAAARGRALFGRVDGELLAGLGFTLEGIDHMVTMLKESREDSRMGVAVVGRRGSAWGFGVDSIWIGSAAVHRHRPSAARRRGGQRAPCREPALSRRRGASNRSDRRRPRVGA